MMSLTQYLTISSLCLIYMFYTLDHYNFCLSFQVNNTKLNKFTQIEKNQIQETCEIILNKSSKHTFFTKSIQYLYLYMNILFQSPESKSHQLNPKYFLSNETYVEIVILKGVHLVIYISSMILIFLIIPNLFIKFLVNIYWICIYIVLFFVIFDFLLLEINKNFKSELLKTAFKYVYQIFNLDLNNFFEKI